GKLGVKKIRFTGGEPLVRKDIMHFFSSVSQLKQQYGFEFGLTTNGTLLEDKLDNLKSFGLDKLNISLDSLRPERFKYITGKDNLESVIRSIRKASEIGFEPLKINVVVMRFVNDDEIIDFVDLVKDSKMNVRFIEFMPFGNNRWNRDGFISYKEMKNIVEAKYKLTEETSFKNLVAKDFNIEGHSGKVSFISSISSHFCESCNRLRIDARGKMKLCLFSTGEDELSFKELLNNKDYSDDDICGLIETSLQLKKKIHPEVDELLKFEENNMLSIGG
ncbi:MAG TPA: radical SAM protein, partial [Ignavibacteriaceae bacterium]|nr:radical SAM protein [Ignavibacteriaceae bacterium]